MYIIYVVWIKLKIHEKAHLEIGNSKVLEKHLVSLILLLLTWEERRGLHCLH